MTQSSLPEIEPSDGARHGGSWQRAHYHVETWGIVFRTKKAADEAAERMRTAQPDARALIWECFPGRCVPDYT